jgi:hypothetical protein
MKSNIFNPNFENFWSSADFHERFNKIIWFFRIIIYFFKNNDFGAFYKHITKIFHARGARKYNKFSFLVTLEYKIDPRFPMLS